MATWSVEERSIPTTEVEGAITSINLEVDPANTAHALMHLLTADNIYTLRFHRNGALISGSKAPVVPPTGGETPETASTHSTHSGKRK